MKKYFQNHGYRCVILFLDIFYYFLYIFSDFWFKGTKKKQTEFGFQSVSQKGSNNYLQQISLEPEHLRKHKTIVLFDRHD